MEQLTREQYADKLIALAAIYRDNEVALPWAACGGGPEFVFCHDPATWHDTVRAFGAGTKHEDNDSVYFVPDAFPWLRINAFKGTVCERVIIGLRQVEEIVIPEKFTPEQRIPAHVEEVVEYRCKPFTRTEEPAAAQVAEGVECPF